MIKKILSTAKEVLQYYQRSTAVLSGEYSSTSTEVLALGKIVVALVFNKYRMSCLELFYPCISFFKVKTNSSPPFGMFLAKIVPPWNNTAFFTMASPRPVPPNFRERPLSTR